MDKKSITDIAYLVIQEWGSAVAFDELFAKVSQKLSLNENSRNEDKTYLYLQLIYDGRFVNLGDNTWDFKSRHPFDKVHIDLNDSYTALKEQELEVGESEEEEGEFSERRSEGEEVDEEFIDSDAGYFDGEDTNDHF
jgi:DNA-directed RNA polymerase subunit delta